MEWGGESLTENPPGVVIHPHPGHHDLIRRAGSDGGTELTSFRGAVHLHLGPQSVALGIETAQEDPRAAAVLAGPAFPGDVGRPCIVESDPGLPLVAGLLLA